MEIIVYFTKLAVDSFEIFCGKAAQNKHGKTQTNLSNEVHIKVIQSRKFFFSLNLTWSKLQILESKLSPEV